MHKVQLRLYAHDYLPSSGIYKLVFSVFKDSVCHSKIIYGERERRFCIFCWRRQQFQNGRGKYWIIIIEKIIKGPNLKLNKAQTSGISVNWKITILSPIILNGDIITILFPNHWLAYHSKVKRIINRDTYGKKWNIRTNIIIAVTFDN